MSPSNWGHLPSTVEDEGNFGLEGIGILPGKMAGLTYHLNSGLELDRENFDANGIWDIILEYPFNDQFRLVGEVNGLIKEEGQPENSGLIGLIWQIGGADFDFAFRRGLSDAAGDWELNTGITFAF